MQLTNICRDVAEDWRRGRIYLPAELLGAARRARSALVARPPPAAVRSLLRAGRALLPLGRRGLRRPAWRCALAVRAARLVYAAIGDVIARRGYDVRAGRAVVSRRASCGWSGRCWRALGRAPAGVAQVGPSQTRWPGPDASAERAVAIYVGRIRQFRRVDWLVYSPGWA